MERPVRLYVMERKITLEEPALQCIDPFYSDQSTDTDGDRESVETLGEEHSDDGTETFGEVSDYTARMPDSTTRFMMQTMV